MKAIKGDWVEIENEILKAGERSINLPNDTRKTPIKMWVRGFLDTEKANIGDSVEINTLANRRIEGTLVEIKPRHRYDFGDTIIELIQIGEELKSQLSNLKEGAIK